MEKKKSSKIYTFAIILILIFFVVASFKLQDELNHLREEKEKLEEELKYARIETERLEEELEMAGSQEHMEKLANEEGYRHPDSVVYENNQSNY